MREVADLTLPLHVVLLCQEAEIVAQGDQSLEQLARLTDPPVERQRADEPERAGEELSLVARQPVVRDGRRVAGDESVTAELARDRVDGVRDALVAPGQEPDQRDVEHTRVELLRPVVLRERAAPGVVALLTDLAVDLVPSVLPALDGTFEREPLREPHGAVEHHPGHDLGVGVVAPWPAAFPDPVVGLAPDRLDMLDYRPPAGPEPLLDRAGELRAERPDCDYFAVDVELELFGGGVADPHRPGALVPWKLR